ncbi:DesA family fatty acid desaturase [Thiohalophilus thiocyanatoxydans]|uniref:Stearoyl-CoA desaturase (Delta-9 desaturase) n=1 Tax=Thiohalophilus thiocyanatoxydans TaxID=381308 RepID=A0A4R8IT39_9GAMM|nr:fatty acid desaturase [Thiohalophilus thiocyanatoxydans]TDY02560.1 stearoyl-CoA desaturase (delta-9 desaturase) [Thiohalophilus thiocyanatoxydans]
MTNFFEGIWSLQPWQLVLWTLIVTHITIASVTIFLHRAQAHNSVKLHPLISHFFRFWLWLTTGMVTRQWVAIHRKHHAKCETDEDPHSPQVKGIRKVLLQGSELYRAEAANQQTLEQYGKGTPNDWLERHVYTAYPYAGIIFLLLINFSLFGPIGITVFAVQMLWNPIWAAGVINGIGHFWGYRNFETGDASRNIIPWGVFIGGEELHNNHHAYAASAKLANKPWEVDIGWVYIRLLSRLGLARVRSVAPRAMSRTDQQYPDRETVRAVVRNRFHILKIYGCQVIKPVLRAERSSLDHSYRKLYRRLRRWMTREDVQLDAHDNRVLAAALEQNQTLATVYRFKQRLKELWARSAENPALRLHWLQQWCAEAERTGIAVLAEFSDYLKGYRVYNA